MRKLTVLFLSIAMLAISAAPSFAMLRKDLASVKGTVVSVNSSRTEITVREMTTGKDVSFSHAGIPADVTSGKPVIVLYKKGTMKATAVRVVNKPGTAAVPAASMGYQAPKTTTTTTTTTTAPATTTKPTKYGW